MAIRHWHPFKLVIIWLISLAILLILWLFASPSRADEQALVVVVWMVLSIPVFILTWRWGSGHEPYESRQQDSPHDTLLSTFKIELLPPKTEPSFIQPDSPVKAIRREYSIRKLKIRKSLLDEGFVVPLNGSEREDFAASYEWAEKHKRYWSIDLLGREIEGWELLSLFPLEAQSGNEELITLALMQRTATDES
jgi:hypothetical protein